MEELYLLDRDGDPFALYEDPAYPVANCLIAPYECVLNPGQQLFNGQMSAVRESVEWVFGKLLTQFAFLDFRENLKILPQPVAKIYLTGTILTNCHTWLYNSQIGDYFGVA